MMKTKDFSVEDVCEFLKANDNFTLLAHAQPDGDTIGSCYSLGFALKAIGKKVQVLCQDKIPAKFCFISNSLKCDSFKDETVVALDIADPKLMGKLQEKYGDCTDLCIDHHISNLHYSKNLLLDAKASATCEIIYKIIKALNTGFTKHILDGLYTGIVTDTGCFKYSNTTAETHRIAAELTDLGVDYAEINRIMFDTKSRSRVKIEGAVMDNMKFCFGGRVAVIAITQKMLNEIGCDESDLDGINALSRTIEGVMAGITIREKAPLKYKISLRTNAPIDATVICARFGGGGHPRAAGCEFNCKLEEIEPMLLPVVEEALEENGCLI